MSAAPKISITIPLDAGMHAEIVRRSALMNKRPVEYVRQLVEAGYAARVRRERNLPANDGELDQAVRAVLCLSGEFDVRAISRATGFPESLVRDILKGFALVAPMVAAPRPVAELSDQREAQPAASRHSEPSAEPAPGDKSVRGWPDEMLSKAAAMWAGGSTTRQIGEAIGKNMGAVGVMMSKRRDLFPYREKAS